MAGPLTYPPETVIDDVVELLSGFARDVSIEVGIASIALFIQVVFELLFSL